MFLSTWRSAVLLRATKYLVLISGDVYTVEARAAENSKAFMKFWEEPEIHYMLTTET